MATRTWTGTAADGSWTNTTNWLEAAVPVTGDAVYFYNSSQAVSTNLAQSAVTLTSLTIDSSYTGTIGTATTLLAIGATNVTIGGVGASGIQGAGATRINLNLGSVASTVTVLSSANSGADVGEPPIRLLGTNIVVNAESGFIGGGTEAGDAATFNFFRVGSGASGSLSSPTVYIGQGSTITEWDIAGGTILDLSNQATTTINIAGGTYTRQGNGAVTTLNILNGTCRYNGTGTITNSFINGTLDFSGDTRAKTVTNCTAYGGTINANNGNPNSIAFTNGIILSGCKLKALNLDVGYSRTIKIS